MADWGTLAAVRARLTYETINQKSSPSEDEVLDWLNEAEAMIRSRLAGAGYSTSYTAGTDAANVLRSKVTDFAVSHVKNAWASRSGEDSDDNGDAEMERFQAFIARLDADATRVASELAGGSLSDSSQYNVSSYALDNDDSLSVSNGDFDAKIGLDFKF